MPTTVDVFTVEEFERIAPTLEGAELVAGRIVPVTPSSTLQALVVSGLVQRLGAYVGAKRLGIVLGPDGGYVIDPLLATVRAPDVSFVFAARVPHPLPRGFARLAPDFVIEVYLDSPAPIAAADRVAEFLRAGTTLVWILDLTARTLATHTAGSTMVYGDNELVAAAPVLPAFAAKLADLIPE
jgi:Uma2 family endonuclease